MKQSVSVTPVLEQLRCVMDFAEDILVRSKAQSRDRTKTLLLLEETFVQLVNASDGTGKMTVTARRRGGTVSFYLRCKGEQVEHIPDSDITADLEDMDAAAEAAIRQMILSANADSFKASYRHGVNTVTVVCGRPSSSAVKRMLISLAFAAVFGIALRFLPSGPALIIDTYVLDPVKTLFMSGLKMIVAPLVFFSIAASVSSFSDLRELGKTGGKVMLFYTFTTVMAVIIGLVMFNVFDPGTLGQLSMAGEAAADVASFSVLDTLVNIIPSNFVSAFLSSDTMQLIFLAFIFGIAATMLGQNSAKVSDFISCASELTVKVAELITSALPVMIFVSVSHLIFTADLSTIRSISAMILCVVLCDIAMLTVYSTLVFVLGKKNPFAFVGAAFPAWLNSFALSSSNAAMSFTMGVCDKRLGIDKSLYSFSIPLGATINMDGLSVLLTFATLFFAKMCGMPLSSSAIFPLIFTVVVLSFGCPGIPGGAILCFSVLLEQFGIPMECVALFAAADAILDPFTTANNVFGDVVGTYIIAARNKLLKKDRCTDTV